MLNKKVIESLAIIGLCGVLTITGITSDGLAMESQNTEMNGDAVEVSTSLDYDATAGVTAVLSSYQQEAAKNSENIVYVNCEEGDMVSATAAEASDAEANEAEAGVAGVSAAEQVVLVASNTDSQSTDSQSADSQSTDSQMTDSQTLSTEEEKWQDKLMADVDEFLYVRAEGDADADIVGKLYKGDLATITEEGSEWTKIESGNVTGYVNNDYCVTGTEAYEYAQKVCDTVATVSIDGLRIRSEQSTDASVIDAVASGTKLTVKTSTETEDGWVAVSYNSETRYVSSDYVTVSLDTGKAVTLEEEQEAIAAEEAAKAAAAASSSSSQKSSSGTKQGSSIAAETDDVTLLAALVQCEAGGCSYKTQLAVAAVVVNRVKSGSYPNSVYKVIYQSAQFGPASSGKLTRQIKSGVSSTAKKAAKAALNGKDNTDGAKAFALASTGHKGTKIGPLVFY